MAGWNILSKILSNGVSMGRSSNYLNGNFQRIPASHVWKKPRVMVFSSGSSNDKATKITSRQMKRFNTKHVDIWGAG